MDSTYIGLAQAEQHHPDSPNSVISMQCLKHPAHTHEVRPMLLTLENLKRTWDIGKQYKTIFGNDYGDDFWKFVSFFVTLEDGEPAKANGLFWVVDDFAGMFYLTNIDPTNDAAVHFAFYKSMHQCKTPLMIKALAWCFDKYQFRRISTEAPTFVAKYTTREIRTLGFVWEGRKRFSRFFDDKYFHVDQYGMLREEFDLVYNKGRKE